MKRFSAFLFIGICTAGIIFLYRFYTGAISNKRADGNVSRMIIAIPSGASSAEIADILYENHIIKNRFVFKFYIRQKGLDAELKAGRFALSVNQRLPEIVETLASGKSGEIPFTIIEGWRASQIAEKLERLGLSTKQEFMDCFKTCFFGFDFLPKKSLEGYLFPDTYFIDPENYSDKAFIKRLIQTFKNKIDALLPDIEKSGRSLDEIVIMASIVEREENDLKERPVVAGILWNRYDAGRGLDADATILYALGRTSGGLSYEDIKTNSLYNTRKYRGLPPTPICSPSLSSLRAALYPEKTEYWYYLHDADGKVHYAKTLKDHNKNKANFL